MFKLGDSVRVDAIIEPGKRGWKKVWIPRQPRHKGEKQGIICGVRTVKEGEIEQDYEYGYTFTPTKHVKVYLVAVSLGQIVRALPEDLELIDGQA